MEADKKKKVKRKVKGSVLAFTAAVSVMLSGLFGNPAEMITPDNEVNKLAIVMTIEENTSSEETIIEEEKKKNLWDTIRQAFLRLPQAVRILVGLPLWAAGWGISELMGGLWTAFLGPAASAIKDFIILAAVILGAFALTAKAAFPHVPFSKILSRKNIILTVAGAAAIKIILGLLPLVWDKAEHYLTLLRFAGGFLLIAFLLIRMEILSHTRAASAES